MPSWRPRNLTPVPAVSSSERTEASAGGKARWKKSKTAKAEWAGLARCCKLMDASGLRMWFDSTPSAISADKISYSTRLIPTATQ